MWEFVPVISYCVSCLNSEQCLKLSDMLSILIIDYIIWLVFVYVCVLYVWDVLVRVRSGSLGNLKDVIGPYPTPYTVAK